MSLECEGSDEQTHRDQAESERRSAMMSLLSTSTTLLTSLLVGIALAAPDTGKISLFPRIHVFIMGILE